VERIERRLGKPDPVPTVAATGSEKRDVADPEPARTEPVSPPAPSSPAEVAVGETGNDETVPLVEPESPAFDVSFEQLQKVWPGLFGSLRDVLGARRWAFFREAVPAAVDGNVIVLEVPHGFHLQSLQEDDAVAAIVATRAGDLLGGSVRVRFGLREGVDAGEDGGDQTIDMTQLEERPQTSTDPTSLLATELGAEVVEE
jgi:hypothetical protein